jgi:hypothetical protein
LTIAVPAASEAPGLVVKRDGVAMGRPVWGTAAPVDPGRHTIEVAAPDRRPWTAETVVDAKHSAVVVTVPRLAELPKIAALPGPAVRDEGGGPSGRKVAGAVIGGAGIVGVGVGAIFGIMASAKKGGSGAHGRQNLCDAIGVELRDDALAAANASTAAFVVGLAAVAGGAVLFLTAPGTARKPKTAWIAPAIGPGLVGASLQGELP